MTQPDRPRECTHDCDQARACTCRPRQTGTTRQHRRRLLGWLVAVAVAMLMAAATVPMGPPQDH